MTEDEVTTSAVNAVDVEHPEAPNMRRQVEYYFSDENLPSDLHLLQCCGGRENLPVSISRICGFKRMRAYKKRDVISALRGSTFLEVSADGKTVWRKTPLVGRCLLDPDYRNDADDDEIAYDPRSFRPVQHPVPMLSQQKKQLIPGVTKGMLKPTGFEDAYVEAPITPEEAAEELAMYDPEKPFVERIEIAIHRFKSKRRMHEMYSKVFSKWMRFGGVENEPRMFGGISKQELAGMSAEEIVQTTATHHVPWDREDADKWVVDFVGVAEGFLSTYYPQTYGYAPSQVKTACQVLRSFFNYLLFHSVCDEYQADLIAARAVCDRADIELPRVYHAGNALPGAFNIAASTIFGGSHAGSYAGHASWAQESTNEDFPDFKSAEEIGMRSEKAMVTFKSGVAIMGSDDQYAALESANKDLSNISIVRSSSLGLEIVGIDPPTQGTREAYASQNAVWGRKLSLQPLGKLVCKPWSTHDGSVWDLPKDVFPENRPTESYEEGDRFEFWVEDAVLEECFVGMKMDAGILWLQGGIVVLDDVREVMCGFYKWLPNELWMAKKPKPVRLVKKSIETDRTGGDGLAEVGPGEEDIHGDGKLMEFGGGDGDDGDFSDEAED